ncbi:cxxc-type zinc finger protein [Anaeramoeba flamelloides]|uniref:Cxxc-type zinc finger protein n=1 Tax=Anaeramoeba flamelloides TaxID=1746091 RepID=A0ABQ8XPZ0_9EUKA|nr:cxxc-type zinc finger protein [Anaeramoeba flamelloides]
MNQVYVYGRGDELPENIMRINVTSRSKDELGRSFSPFLLGPLKIYPFNGSDHFECNLFENAWQYLKVYDKYSEKSSYLKWLQTGCESKKAHRFPMGRGAKPMYSLWKGERLKYIEARFKIYAPLYAWCIENCAQESYQKLQKLFKKHKKIALFDYDGYNYINAGLSLNQVIYNHKRKMGHSFVLAMMLTNNRVWEKDFDHRKIFFQSVPRSRITRKRKHPETKKKKEKKKEKVKEKEKKKEKEKRKRKRKRKKEKERKKKRERKRRKKKKKEKEKEKKRKRSNKNKKD